MSTLPSINPKQEAEKIVNFLKSVQKKTGINKVVIGLSGGIDSTIVHYLLKKAYKPENIIGVNLPIDLIRPIVDKFEDVKADEVNGIFSLSRGAHPTEGREGRDSRVIKIPLPSPKVDKVRLGNIMARTRMIILFDLAKQLGALVCGTENKSEKLLGYFTRFGDAASDIEPISYLYKTQIYQLAKYLKIPKEIINQKPSAGLWDGQTDESDFGFTYQEADQVLYLFEQSHCHSRGGGNPEHQALDPLLQGDDKKQFPTIEKIIKFVQKNQFKQKTPYSL